MAARIRAFDWAATPLGPVADWPERLRLMVEQVLASPMVSSLACGPERLLIYNDAAARLYGERHPAVLGRPLPEAFPEGWPVVAPFYERAFAGESVVVTGQPLDTRGESDAAADVFDAYLTPVREDGAVACVHMTGFEVGERVRAEAALRESEARYRAFVTASSDVVYRMSPDWSQMRQLDGRGFLTDTLVPSGAWMDHYIHPDDQPQVRAAIARAIREKAPFELEHRVRRADGSLGWTRSRAVPILDEGGRIAEWLGAASDVTARQEAERAQRAGEEQQSFLLALSDALRPLEDPIAIQREASRVLRQQLGAFRVAYAEMMPDNRTCTLLAEDVTDDAFSLAGMVADWDAFDPVAFAASQKGETFGREDLQAADDLTPERKAAFASVNVRAFICTPLVKSGRLVAFFVAHFEAPRRFDAKDIALTQETAERTWATVERARAEASLRESEERYRTLFETMDEGLVIGELVRDGTGKANDFRYLYLNPALERLSGWKVEETVGRCLTELVPAEEARYWADIFSSVQASRASERVEHFVEPLDRWFRVNAMPYGNGRIATIYQNITEQKRGEAILRESEKRQAFLLRLSDALRAPFDASAIVALAVEMLAAEMASDRAYIVVFNPEEDRADLIGQVCRPGVVPHPANARLSQFPTLLSQMHSETLVVRDAATEPALNATDRRSLAAVGTGALIGAPLRHGSATPFWMLVTSSVAPRRWSESEVRLVEDVAERTWAATERASAETALRASEARLASDFSGLQRLYALNTRLADEPDLQARLEGIVEAANSFLGTDRGCIQLVSRDGERLEMFAYRGYDAASPFVRHFRREGSKAACDAARGHRRRLVIEDVETFPALQGTPDREIALQSGIRATQSTPMVTRGGAMVGVLSNQFRELHRPSEDALRLVDLLAWSAAEIVEHQRAEAALRESEARFAQFAASSSDALWIRNAATLAMEYTSPAIRAIYGVAPDALLGDPERWAALVLPEDRDAAFEHLGQARRGEPVLHEFRIRRPSDGQERWIRDTDCPLRDAEGRVQRIGGIAQDVTAEKETAERQAVLVAELQHRTRNLMGVVRAMADKTMRRSADLADFQTRYGDRLAALSRVQGLLSRLAEGERITFDALVRTEVAALDGATEKVTLEGPDGVALRSSTVQTFALALHELATNAVKYGAFAQAQGRLDIRWRVERAETDGRPWLHVDWRERGVAMPAKDALPQGGGSGRELIERALPYQLGAKTTYVMDEDGVHCIIALPVSERQAVMEVADVR